MLPVLLTAAVAALAPAEIGPDYGSDVGQMVQTVVIPVPSRWEVSVAVENGVCFKFDRILDFDHGGVTFRRRSGAIHNLGTYPYEVEAATSGPVRIAVQGLPGICKMEGKQLLLCLQTDSNAPVPKSFTSKPGDGALLLILERENP